MPEIMEVKKYCDFIRDHFQSKKILDIVITNGRYKKHNAFDLYKETKKLLPLKLLDISSKGKFIYFILEGDNYILNTLGLSGGWAYLPNNKKSYVIPKLLYYTDKNKVDHYLMTSLEHINVELIFEKGKLCFFDQLSFGTMKIINNKAELDKKLKTIGPDIMDLSTTFDVFKERIRKKTNDKKPIGNVLMNQKIISGIGNYIRADTLWYSKINPFRKTNTLTDDELEKIFNSTKIICWTTYDKKKGIDYGQIKKTDKGPYDYKRDFFVYREEKDMYGNEVISEELYEGSQKRTIWWVPKIQK